MTPYSEHDVLLRINKISKSYGGVPVLKEVTAAIRDIQREGCITGQVIGFLGPSGVGKTTLFRILAGLEQPTSGAVTLNDGRPVSPGEVGVVAQNYPLFAHRTVWGNLMRAAGKVYSAKDASHIVMTSLKEFGLQDYADRYPAQLSGGQRQRCAIMQQVLCSSHFLLFDEPFSGLDIIAKKKTIALIQRVANLAEENTIIIVTHDIPAAVSIADHIWLLGRDHDDSGKPIPGAYIKESINLIDRGLAWQPNVEALPEFAKTVLEIGQKFPEL